MAICGRTRESVDRAATELKQSPGGDVFGHPADVSISDQVAGFFDAVESRFGALDILVNNAGAGIFRGIQDLTLEDWRNTIDLNLSGVFYCCHYGLPLLRKRGEGYIIQISSLAGMAQTARIRRDSAVECAGVALLQWSRRTHGLEAGPNRAGRCGHAGGRLTGRQLNR